MILIQKFQANRLFKNIEFDQLMEISRNSRQAEQ